MTDSNSQESPSHTTVEGTPGGGRSKLAVESDKHLASLKERTSAHVARQVEPESMDTAQMHLDLNRLSTQHGDESEIREQFRKIIQQYTGAVGVGHVIRDREGNWDLKPNHSTGRVPRRHDFVERFAKCCEITTQRNTVQVESFLGLESFYTPIQVFGAPDEVLLVLTGNGNSARTIFQLEIIAAYFGLWLKAANSQRSDWKLSSLAALVELVSRVESQETIATASQVIASELARQLQCSQVAVATRFNSRLQVQAISGTSSLDYSSNQVKSIETAISETLLRGELTHWPQPTNEDHQLLLGHKQLASLLDAEAITSIPLRMPEGEVIAGLLVVGSHELLQGDRLPNFLRAAAPRLASALAVVRRAQKSRLMQVAQQGLHKLRTLRGRLAIVAGAAILAMLSIPVPYRVRSNCKVESTQQRFVVAPFQGIVEDGFYEEGDHVRSGELLARMDARQIRYELAQVRAEREQSAKQREIALTNRNIGESMLSELEYQRLTAKLEQLEQQRQQVEIRSPVDGVILSGSLKQAQGTAVDVGKVLYEVGTLDQLQVEVAIPAEEIGQIEVGQRARVWIRGFENESFRGTLSRIQPRSELRDSRNVFVAEIAVANPDGKLLPGMEGSVRIDCQPQPLGWNLFHKPWEFLVSRFSWW